MKRKLWLTAGILGIVTLVAANMPFSPFTVAAQGTATTPVFVAAQTAFGMMVVNESNGEISFCANNTVVPGGGGGQAPIGGRRRARRCHAVAVVVEVVRRLASAGIPPGVGVVAVAAAEDGRVAVEVEVPEGAQRPAQRRLEAAQLVAAVSPSTQGVLRRQ